MVKVIQNSSKVGSGRRGGDWWVHVFSVMMLAGVGVVIGSGNWVGAWVGMEISMIGFACHVSLIHGESSWGGMCSLFIAQILASVFLVFSFTAGMLMGVNWKWIGLGALLVKMGIPPFHWWYPKAIGDLGWCSIWVLSTLMKVGPLVMVGMLAEDVKWLICFASCFGYLASGLQGVNQNTVRGILAYSSMGNCCWMMVASCISKSVLVVFMVCYGISMAFLLYVCSKEGLFRVSGTGALSMRVMVLVGVVALSLAGLPPFLGFGAKIWVIVPAIKSGVVWVVILLAMSVIHAGYYLSFVVNSLASKVLGPEISHVSGAVVVVGVMVHMVGGFFLVFLLMMG